MEEAETEKIEFELKHLLRVDSNVQYVPGLRDVRRYPRRALILLSDTGMIVLVTSV